MATLFGIVWKYNGTLVFCPDLYTDIRLGRPNDGWIKTDGGAIINLSDFPNIKEGDEVQVEVNSYYNSEMVECMAIEEDKNNYMKSFNGLWFNCKITKIM